MSQGSIPRYMLFRQCLECVHKAYRSLLRSRVRVVRGMSSTAQGRGSRRRLRKVRIDIVLVVIVLAALLGFGRDGFSVAQPARAAGDEQGILASSMPEGVSDDWLRSVLGDDYGSQGQSRYTTSGPSPLGRPGGGKTPPKQSGLLSSASWTEESNEASAYFGVSVASARDVNRDGYSDVIIGAHYYGSDDRGKAYVFAGSATGLTHTLLWTAEGTEQEDWFGATVASAGDVNRDGFGDVIVAAELYGADDHGKVYVYYGPLSGVDATPDWTAEGTQSGERFGHSAASAGDVNGDGYGDIVIGSPYFDTSSSAANEDSGRVAVYHGSASGLGQASSWVGTLPLDMENINRAQLGWAASSAGDVNHDGYADVLIGAPGIRGPGLAEYLYIGQVFLSYGSPAGLGGFGAWTYVPDTGQCYPTFVYDATYLVCGAFGDAVAPAGDVNDDGYADFVVSADLYSTRSAAQQGKAYVFYGSPSGPTSVPWTYLAGQEAARLGVSVSSAGDVNADGFGDVIIGANQYSNGQTREGRAFVFYGGVGGLGTAPSWTKESDQMEAQFGISVGSAGDVNADGVSDVIIGAFGYSNGQTFEGRAFVYQGARPATALYPGVAGGGMGWALASNVDVNGDGYQDVVVGAPGVMSSTEGRVYVFLGSSSGVGTSPSASLTCDQPRAEFGSAVASAGDVNRDGFGDVLVGAPEYVNGTYDYGEGRVFLFLGSHSGLSSVPAWTFEVDQRWARLGEALASAGDVNGDGYSDVIVGDYEYDGVGYTDGKAWVFLGTPTGLSKTPAWSASAPHQDAYFGFAVASAGDVNRDGYADVLISAPIFSLDLNRYSSEGRVYLYTGSATGLRTSPAWTHTGSNPGDQYGTSVASAGDVNNDGYGDVVIGDVYYSHGQTYEGLVELFLGSAAGLASTPRWSYEGNRANAYLGYSVQGVRDVNADGYGDVAVGMLASGVMWEGKILVFLGRNTGLATSPAWSAVGNQGDSQFGIAISAGDVNRDGFADLVIGASGWDAGGLDAGVVFLFYGSSAGLPS